jgi:hypothetical protein
MKIFTYLHTNQYGVLIECIIVAIANLTIAYGWNVFALKEAIMQLKKNADKKRNAAVETFLESVVMLSGVWFLMMYHLRHFSYGLPIFVRGVCAIAIFFLLILAFHRSWIIAKRKYYRI